MVEAMSSILNSGDLPNLYKPEDMESILGSCRALAQQAGVPPTKVRAKKGSLPRGLCSTLGTPCSPFP